MRDLFRTGSMALCLLGLGLASLPASAAIYLCNEGKTVEGDVQLKDYEGCIEVLSFQDGVEREINSQVGAGRDVLLPSFADITLTKKMDRASVPLRREAVDGGDMNWSIHFLAEGETPCEYYTIELTEARISSHHMSSSGELPVESMSLNFTKVQYTYFLQNEQGACGAPITWGYDLETATQQ